MKRTLLRVLLLAFACTASSGCKTCLDCEEGEPRVSLRFTNRSGVDCDLKTFSHASDGRTIEASTSRPFASDSTSVLPYDALDRRAPTSLPTIACPAEESCLVFSEAERSDVPDLRVPSNYGSVEESFLDFTITPAHRSAAGRCPDAG